MLESTVLLNLAQHQPLSIPAKTFEHTSRVAEKTCFCARTTPRVRSWWRKIPGVLHVDPRCDEALDRVLFDLYQRHVIQGQLRAPLQRRMLRASLGKQRTTLSGKS